MTTASTSTIQSLMRFLTGLFLISILCACGGGGSTAGVSGGSSGTLAVQLTDAPIGSVTEVNVHIVGLKIKRSDAPVQTLAFAGRTVNLLALQNTMELMIQAEVPAGDYDFIQIELDQDQSNVVENNQAKPLKIPSEEIKVLGGFVVLPDGFTTVLLDFDAEASLMQTNNDGWHLKPVILQANVSTS